MVKSKKRMGPSHNFSMAEIMVGQWTDARLKEAKATDLIRAYGVDILEAEKLIERELRKRKWIS